MRYLKSIGTESRIVVTGAEGDGGKRSFCLVGRVSDLQDERVLRSVSQQYEYT